MSSRRLANLVRRLPPDSELGKEVNGEIVTWSRTEQLLARLVDELALSRWVFMRANFEGAPDQPPAPMPRPGIEAPEDHEPSPEQIAGFFAGL